MKKTGKLMLFLFIAVFAPKVFAYELSCEDKTLSYNDEFICQVKGDNLNYNVLSGSINNNEFLSCERYTNGVGLTLISDENDKSSFSYTGKLDGGVIVSYKCKVIKEVDNQSTELIIENFKHHEVGSQAGDVTEILRSNKINIKKQVEMTTTRPTITKPRDTSNANSRLKSLKDKNLDITFSGFVTEYNVEVLYEVDEVNLEIIPFNSEAKVNIVGSQKLALGDNVIDIYVTSPDELYKTCYTLNIKRLARGEEIYYEDADSSLKSLTITGQNIKFEKEILEYHVHITADVDALEINAIPTVSGANVDIKGNENLKNNSKVVVTVTSKDKSKSTDYNIFITKDAPKKDNSSIIILGILLILLILVIAIIIITSKKNKKDPILKLKNDKKKMNYGEKFDSSIVPESNNQETIKNENIIPTNEIVTEEIKVTPIEEENETK